MPTINLPQRKPKAPRGEAEYTDTKLLRRKFYNSSKWQKLRDAHLREHPLCEQCLSKGKVTPADQVHHKRSPFNYKEGTINWELGLDPENLESICGECHGKIHAMGEDFRTPEQIINELNKLLND